MAPSSVSVLVSSPCSLKRAAFLPSASLAALRLPVLGRHHKSNGSNSSAAVGAAAARRRGSGTFWGCVRKQRFGQRDSCGATRGRLRLRLAGKILQLPGKKAAPVPEGRRENRRTQQVGELGGRERVRSGEPAAGEAGQPSPLFSSPRALLRAGCGGQNRRFPSKTGAWPPPRQPGVWESPSPGRARAAAAGGTAGPRAQGGLCARSTQPLGSDGARSTHLPLRLGERLIGPTAITADCFPNKQCQREDAPPALPEGSSCPAGAARSPPAIKAFIVLFSPPHPSGEELAAVSLPSWRRQPRRV